MISRASSCRRSSATERLFRLRLQKTGLFRARFIGCAKGTAGQFPASRPFDLDDIGTKIPKHLRRARSEHDLAESPGF